VTRSSEGTARTTNRQVIVTLRARFWAEAALGSVTAGLTMLTLLSREWIEILFRVDPDGGDGSIEWAIVGGLLVLTLFLSWLARAEWRNALARSRSEPGAMGAST
jgi:hypothetical protein